MPEAAQSIEYRVVYRREGLRTKYRRFSSRAAVDRFLLLLGPEPWKGKGLDPDALYCCSGHDCGCGGMTVRQEAAAAYEGMPPLVTVRVESRSVPPWETCRECPVCGVEALNG